MYSSYLWFKIVRILRYPFLPSQPGSDNRPKLTDIHLSRSSRILFDYDLPPLIYHELFTTTTNSPYSLVFHPNLTHPTLISYTFLLNHPKTHIYLQEAINIGRDPAILELSTRAEDQRGNRRLSRAKVFSASGRQAGINSVRSQGRNMVRQRRGGRGLAAVETPLFPRCFIRSTEKQKLFTIPWTIDLFALSRRSLAGNNAAQRYTLIRKYPPVTIHGEPSNFRITGVRKLLTLLSVAFSFPFFSSAHVRSNVSSLFRAATLKKLEETDDGLVDGYESIKYSMNSEAALYTSATTRPGKPENFRIKFLPSTFQRLVSSLRKSFNFWTIVLPVLRIFLIRCRVFGIFG